MANPNNRLIAAIGMMGSTTNGDAEAVSAFRAASSMLARDGLTWSDVAQRAFGEQQSTKRGGMADWDSVFGPNGAFGDIFSGIARVNTGDVKSRNEPR